MQNIQNQVIKLPTGFLIVDTYSKGQLETLSIGDYGKEHNVKAQFLGYNDDVDGVSCKKIAPLTNKWVITLSTQYGCPQKCTFCDVPNVKFKGNASVADLQAQFDNAVEAFPEVRYTDRLNVHFARMGEPMLNFNNVFNFATRLNTYNFRSFMIKEYDLRLETIHPVFTTMLPKSVSLEAIEKHLISWCDLKNYQYNGQAGLQLSINSTSPSQRNEMFGGKAHDLIDISTVCKKLPFPLGRKYTLNFALADGYEVDAALLAELFDTERFMVKITPIHNNNACSENNIKTSNGYVSGEAYREVEKDLIAAGFDVLIFVPSEDEEKSTITCGNAILGGSLIKE